MKFYADTSFLIKLISLETESPAAFAEYRRLNRPNLPFSLFHELELTTALQQKMFLGKAQNLRVSELRRELEYSVSKLQRFLSKGVFRRVEIDWQSLLFEAIAISDRETEAVGCRSLDLMHVGAALALESSDFLTFDFRQAELAKRKGLNVISLGKK